MIDAAKLVAAHLASMGERREQGEGEQVRIEPNAERTHVAMPRVRLYVAQPRSAS